MCTRSPDAVVMGSNLEAVAVEIRDECIAHALSWHCWSRLRHIAGLTHGVNLQRQESEKGKVGRTRDKRSSRSKLIPWPSIKKRVGRTETERESDREKGRECGEEKHTRRMTELDISDTGSAVHTESAGGGQTESIC